MVILGSRRRRSAWVYGIGNDRAGGVGLAVIAVIAVIDLIAAVTVFAFITIIQIASEGLRCHL